MVDLNLETYFDSKENKYYDAKYIITVLEKSLGKNFDTIKDEINNEKILVNMEQIEKFLDKVFDNENFELKHRIDNRKNTTNESLFYSEQVIDKEKIEDDLIAKRYCFEPYTLRYFNKYTDIVRNKALQLLNIIEKIGIKQSYKIKKILKELDIQLDQNGNITKEDILRLITPTIQNISELNEKVSIANKLSTYLTFKMSKDIPYRYGLSESEIYPSTSIFIKDLHNGHSYGNIPISIRQEQELHEQIMKSSKIMAKVLTKLN